MGHSATFKITLVKLLSPLILITSFLPQQCYTMQSYNKSADLIDAIRSGNDDKMHQLIADGATLELYISINLSNSKVSDDWLTCSNKSTQSLKDGDRNPKVAGLYHVNLSGASVTKAGVKYLLSLPYLRCIKLINTNVTETGLTALQKSRPEIHVIINECCCC